MDLYGKYTTRQFGEVSRVCSNCALRSVESVLVYLVLSHLTIRSTNTGGMDEPLLLHDYLSGKYFSLLEVWRIRKKRFLMFRSTSSVSLKRKQLFVRSIYLWTFAVVPL